MENTNGDPCAAHDDARTGFAARLIAAACLAGVFGIVAAPLERLLPAPASISGGGPAKTAAVAARAKDAAKDGAIVLPAFAHDDAARGGTPAFWQAGAPEPAPTPAASPTSAASPTLAASPPSAPPLARVEKAEAPVRERAPSAAPPVALPAVAVAVAARAEEAAPHRRADAFVGVWGVHASACSPLANRKRYLLAAIDNDGAWAGETFCAFRDKRETGDGWSVSARCTSPRERWTTRVRLRMDGAKLTWSSQRGTQTYVRCERRLLTAQVTSAL